MWQKDKNKFSRIENGLHIDLVNSYCPKLCLRRWDSQCYFTVNLKDSFKFASSLDRSSNKLFLDQHIFYVTPDGKFEWETVFDKKPESNIISYTFDFHDLDFRYQDPIKLLRDRRKGIVSFDPNILGSFAVYHKRYRHNQFSTGKAFHIFRPEVIDANGNKTWCELVLYLNVLSVIIPQWFLDSAKYPVILDPTIGYETLGATGISAGDEVLFYKITMPENGVLTKIHSGTASYEAPIAYHALYANDTSEDPDSLIEEETTGYVPGDWPDGAWHEVNMAGTSSLVGGISYWIAIVANSTTNGGFRLRGDYNDYQYVNAAMEAGTVFPATASAIHGSEDYDMSLYITYDTVSTPSPITMAELIY